MTQPSPLTREDLKLLANCFPYDMLERCKSRLLDHDAALRLALSQQAQEIERLTLANEMLKGCVPDKA